MQLDPTLYEFCRKKYWKQALNFIVDRSFSEEDKIKIFSGNECYCNLCELGISEFFPYGHPQTENDICPICRSFPRHRVFKYWMDIEKNKFPTNSRILHFAPEKSVTSFLKKIGGENYLSVDIVPNRGMKVEDITNLSFPNNSFDLILCSYVVQHVPDDDTAIKELHRVLDKSGILVLISSMYDGPTKEVEYAPGGIKTYRKMYNVLDLKNKLICAGFNAEIVQAKDFISEKTEFVRLGIPPYFPMFICTK